MNELQPKSFKDSLNLPKTDFSIRASASEKEPELLARWKEEGLNAAAQSKNSGREKFILHDGPPYANGRIHMGTALNKTLKDFVAKYKRMTGFHVSFRPGWDCHGLPIELKVLAESGEATMQQLDPVAFKAACRKFAHQWIDVQRDEFQKLGVLADWRRPYMTMDPMYEANILRAFAKFVAQGVIERKGKTVPWCASCQTVLATAEIEYTDRTDPSCFIAFPLRLSDANELFSDVVAYAPKIDISLLVWTTTPWTIPLNRAVMLNPKATYELLEGKDQDTAFLVVAEQVDAVCGMLGIEKKILASIPADELAGREAEHPFIDQLIVPVLLDEMVLTSDGTGVLHAAPGCGPEDYLAAQRHGLEVFSPISSDGKYTKGIKPVELEGMLVADGQIWVMRTLGERGKLVHKQSINHAYPHCWRCRNGLIFRATDQWFCNLQQNDLIQRTLAEIEKIDFIPRTGRARLQGSIETRAEWCISRQRNWGTPIPALLCKKCSCAYINAAFIQKVADGVAREGIEYWDRLTIATMQQHNMLPADFACAQCKNKDLSEFTQERDILDVWFDSGVSHFAVLEQDAAMSVPADMYLEGSDQHRGWFQSALLSAMIMRGSTPTKLFVTHGFVVDEHGHKMSKSVGNVVTPQEIIQKYSTDILRLWVASTDYTGDIAISETLMRNVAEVYRKIRNTARFLISNLYDFDVAQHSVRLKEMLAIDQYALAHLHEVAGRVHAAYKRYDFAEVYGRLSAYCATDLSSFYLDIIKDRLYCDQANGKARRSAQTACYHILDTLTCLMAPILSFLAEEVSDEYQRGKRASIHLQDISSTVDVWTQLKRDLSIAHDIDYEVQKTGQWHSLIELRDMVLKALEVQRAAGLIKHSLEARVTLHVDETTHEGGAVMALLTSLRDHEQKTFLPELFIVSQCAVAPSVDSLEKTEMPWIHVHVEHASGTKCPRCWQWDTTTHLDGLCSRCARVLG